MSGATLNSIPTPTHSNSKVIDLEPVQWLYTQFLKHGQIYGCHISVVLFVYNSVVKEHSLLMCKQATNDA